MRKLVLLALCMSLAISQLWAQATRTVTGKVTDAQGNPVPAAAVQVKGNTRIGTTTANDGSFSLNVPQNATTLVISSLNFAEKEVSIVGQNNVTVQMTESTGPGLDEVVVTVPYGTIKRTSFTGSENTITTKQIQNQQVASVTKALEGLAPGILATNGGGAPGSGATIILRGFASVTGNVSPLYVLNGVPYYGDINAIAPDDIESVSILKDATATALFGSRAAGGVIMITTKTGKKGRPAISARVSQGYMARGIPEYDRVDPKTYMEMMWEATRNSFQYGQNLPAAQAGVLASQQLTDANHLVYNPYNLSGTNLIDPATGKMNPNAQLLWNDSWEDALFRTAPRTNATVSISGANDKTNYYVSGSYLSEDGIMKFTDFKRYSFRAAVNSQATDYLSAGVTIDGTYKTGTGVIATGSFTSNPFYYSRNMGPIYPIWQRDPATGAFTMDAAGNRVLDWGNPTQMGTRPYAPNSNLLGSLELDERSTKTINATAQPYVEVRFLKDFTLRTNLSVTVTEDDNLTYQNSQFGDAQNVQGRATKQFVRLFSITANQLLNWSKSFGVHSVRALAGHETWKWNQNQLSATKTGFQFPGFTDLDNAGTTEGTPSSRTDEVTLESYFGQINYDYRDKYLLNVNARRDGSSRLHPDVRWGTFFSAGAGWVISNEDFMKNINWINTLKLKASYGETGNEASTGLYNYTNYLYANGLGQYLGPSNNKQANPELIWETNVKLNLGVDFTLFSNRLQGSLEYFRNTNEDLIFTVNKAPSQGLASGGFLIQDQNIGSSRNSGVELQLGYNAIRKRNFDWRIDLNLTHFKNKVISTYPAADATGGFVSGTKKITAGYDQMSFWLREFAGVDASTGDALYYKDVLGTDGKPTGERVLTNNISQASFYRFGSAIPDFNGGLSNSFRYKNFDLSVLLTFAYGGQFYDGNYAGLMHAGSYGTAWHTDILKRWQKPGDVTNVPRVQNAIAQQEGQSSRFLMDGSYMNVKNITLSYTLPANVAKRMHVANLQVFGNVDNAFLLTAKKGMDPQRAFTGTSDASYVPFRTVTFGLSVNL